MLELNFTVQFAACIVKERESLRKLQRENDKHYNYEWLSRRKCPPEGSDIEWQPAKQYIFASAPLPLGEYKH